MCFAGKTATDKILAILLPIAAFVAGGFEHCVANMYFVPMGLFLKASAGSGPAGLTWGNFLLRNLLPVTLGNMVGGAVLVAGLLWVIYQRFDHEPRYRERML
jgi:formate/nitrite transporter FocA (FNT family)